MLSRAWILLLLCYITVAIGIYRPPPPTPKGQVGQICGRNEYFAECSGCEASCDNLRPVCFKMCRPPKCQCKPGFVRNGLGVCVTKEQCPATTTKPTPDGHTCPANEEYARCKNCVEETCLIKNPPLCPMPCMPGCTCKQGFVRFEGNGRCESRRLCASLLDAED